MHRSLARALCPHGSVRRALWGPARGQRFFVEPGIGLSYALATATAAPRHFRAWIRPGMTVYDVGANKGQMALLFAALVGEHGKVVSFEPAPAEFGSLERNVELNDLQTRVRLINAAVADRVGEMTFMYAADRPTQGKLLDVEPTYDLDGSVAMTVPTVLLDGLLDQEGPPDVIKLDVEGAATTALRGAARILDEFAPAIYVELHGPEEQAGIRDELFTRGYVAETLDGRRVYDPTSAWHSPLWCHRPGQR